MKKRFRLNWHLVLGAALFVLLVGAAALAPVVAPWHPNQVHRGASLAPPSAEFPLGTDQVGRDVLSRVIWGARTSLLVTIPAVLLAVVAGTLLGTVSGFWGGRVDDVIMRLADVAYAFPGVLLAVTIVAVLGPSIPNLIMTIAILYTPRFIRVVRAPILTVRELDYVTAAKSLGAPALRLIWKHVLPNSLSPVIVAASLSLSSALFTESALAFLGLGAPPPDPTWGSMMSRSRQFMEIAPWAVMAPGAAIMLATTSFVLLGNGLRDWLDPTGQV